MSAGASARYEAQRSLLEADAYERLAKESRQRAECFRLAAKTEASVAGRLGALSTLGWTVLADRRWPGSKRANVDCLLVGPGGVVLIDVKAWRSLEMRFGSVFCGDECRDDEVSKHLALLERVHESLSELGLARQAITPALVFAGRHGDFGLSRAVHLVGELSVAAWVSRLRQRLGPDEIETVSELLAEACPASDAAPRAVVKVPRVRIAMPARKPVEADALFDVQEIADSLLQSALEGPIESWMTFLHPDQAKLIGSNYSGPSRVRGPAGTGKTVVALHRAAHLAQRTPKKVLFVSFVKTLPAVLGALCERLAPHARGNIEFTGLHRLAIQLLDLAGVPSRIDGVKANRAFAEAWKSHGASSRLTRLDERPSYWKEEIDYVIKGRALVDYDEYADLSRIGRRTPMRNEDREAMWGLYVEYERLLDRYGVHDFTDVLIMARDLVRDGKIDHGFGPVIVDEVQDLNLVGLQLLHAIAGDGPDGLHIVGDGQQSVYPGGFTLAEAGINVTGRASVLTRNYRNTVEILETATRLVAADEFNDLEGQVASGKRPVEVVRHGHAPLIVRADDRRSLEIALVRQVEETVRVLQVPLGDMAVLVQTRADLGHYLRVLERAAIPTIELQDYDGVTSDRLKVGTFKRAKGLEFKYVLIPGLREAPAEPWPGESDDAFRERAERTRRELYVGMTRARDGLWLGYEADSTPRKSPARL